MIWNRDLAGIIVALLMLTSLVLMIIKRKRLEQGSFYFISAVAVIIVVDTFSLVGKHFSENYNSTIFYVLGINLVAFFLFFMYFHQLLKSVKLKRINLILILLFFINFIYSAVVDDHFFKSFPFFNYFIEVLLLSVSIYLVMSQTFNSDKILYLRRYFPFWVCLSLLVTYLGVMPLLIVSFTAENMMNVTVFHIVMFSVNLVGYSILLVGILNVKKIS